MNTLLRHTNGQAHTANDLVRAYLHDRPIGCPACDYNLRGAAGDLCPECGVKLELQLIGARTPIGRWLIGLLAVALPLGFVGILALAGAFAAARQSQWWWNDSDWTIIGALWGLTIGYSILLAIVIRRRPRFLQLSRLEQRVRAWGTVVVMAALQVAVLWAYSRFGANW